MTNHRLSGFENAHDGEACVLVCNGPSLNEMDLTRLIGRVTFGLNKIFLGIERFGFFPRYLVAVNEKVIRQSRDELQRMQTVKFLSEECADVMPEDPYTYHIRTKGLPERFYRDITQGVRGGHTVTHAALQIIRYMGFKEVVIIGMDHRFSHGGRPNAEEYLDGDDTNHFSKAYFRDQKWDAPNLVESEVSYRLAREIFEADGRRILDATVNGACNVFEKADYRDVLR